jgi:hypothetical protein
MTESEILALAARNRESTASDAFKALMGYLASLSKTHSPLLGVAASNMAAMLANPVYEPSTEKGETRPQATARRAVEYAEELLAEVARREATLKGGTQ